MPVLQGADPDEYEVYVFNRWGEVVWHSETLNVPWDGLDRVTGLMLKTDVYAWRIKAKDIMLGEKHEFKGHVTLLK